jgi:ATP-dependent protease ClpP protease subunit
VFYNKILVSLIYAFAFHSTVTAHAAEENNHIPQNCEAGMVVFASNSLETSDLEAFASMLAPCTLSQNPKEVTVVITGGGGEVEAMAAIYDYVLTTGMRKHITTRAVGELASATIPFFLLGSKREAAPNTHFMFHNPRMYANGVMTTRDIDEQKSFSAVAEKTYIDTVVANSKLSREQVERFMNEVKVLNASEALEYGLVHTVLDAK